MARNTFTATTDTKGADKRFARGVIAVRNHTEHGLKKLRSAGEELLALHAPEESGRLISGIRGIIRGRRILVFTVRAEDPDSGFDYVDVTRFGHRVARIYPGQKARSVTSPVALTAAGTPRITSGRGARADIFRGAKVLKTKHGYFASVRGYKPSRDWVEPAIDDIQDAGGRVVESIGRGVARTLSR
jgi:hypothetical protein